MTSIVISDNFESDKCPNPDCGHSIEGDHTMIFDTEAPTKCVCDACDCEMVFEEAQAQ